MIDREWIRLVTVLHKRYGTFKWGVLTKEGKNGALLSEPVKKGAKYLWRIK